MGFDLGPEKGHPPEEKDLTSEVLVNGRLDVTGQVDEARDDLLLVGSHAGVHGLDLGLCVHVNPGGHIAARSQEFSLMIVELLLSLPLVGLDLHLGLFFGLFEPTVLTFAGLGDLAREKKNSILVNIFQASIFCQMFQLPFPWPSFRRPTNVEFLGFEMPY